MRTSTWPMSIRDIQVKARSRPLPSTVCGWRWSNILRSNAALCCCRAAGLWSAASLGPRASVVWPEITNASPKHWKGSTISPSPSSCSPIWRGNSRKVNNRL